MEADFFLFFLFVDVKKLLLAVFFNRMKRLRDDVYDSPSFKRPFESNKGESYVVWLVSILYLIIFLYVLVFDGFFLIY